VTHASPPQATAARAVRDPGVLVDPHPLHRRLRGSGPVRRSPLGPWVLTRDADVLTALVWPRPGGGVTVQRSPDTSRRVAHRHGLAVAGTEHLERLSPQRHAVTVDGLEFLTVSAEAVLPPGVLTPGYALRLA
jgi:hypothetical protein